MKFGKDGKSLLGGFSEFYGWNWLVWLRTPSTWNYVFDSWYQYPIHNITIMSPIRLNHAAMPSFLHKKSQCCLVMLSSTCLQKWEFVYQAKMFPELYTKKLWPKSKNGGVLATKGRTRRKEQEKEGPRFRSQQSITCWGQQGINSLILTMTLIWHLRTSKHLTPSLHF